MDEAEEEEDEQEEEGQSKKEVGTGEEKQARPKAKSKPKAKAAGEDVTREPSAKRARLSRSGKAVVTKKGSIVADGAAEEGEDYVDEGDEDDEATLEQDEVEEEKVGEGCAFRCPLFARASDEVNIR